MTINYELLSPVEIKNQKSEGELVFAIYQTIYDYNHSRIHSALRAAHQNFPESDTSFIRTPNAGRNPNFF